MKRAVISAGEIVFRSDGLAESIIDTALAGEFDNAFVERLEAPQRVVVSEPGTMSGDVPQSNGTSWRNLSRRCS